VNDASPQLLNGANSPSRFAFRENGLFFEFSFEEGYSVGLFLDQRDNRRRFLVNHVGAGFTMFPGGARNAAVLNTFAYTCGFSVAAAKAGARVTSVDLSRKYLAWGERNFDRNGIDPAAHEFIVGDVFDWLRRFAKRRRCFDCIILDPPTFSHSKTSGTWRAEKDFGPLVEIAVTLLRPNGVLLACTNAAKIAPERFLDIVTCSVRRAGRGINHQHYVPQPPDFPISRKEPAHLKTVWLRIQ
jgi:23S rRNA (cytosine1962-C5)-methyltransferase